MRDKKEVMQGFLHGLESDAVKSLLLFVVLAYALYVRFLHVAYGLPYVYHHDEPQIASTAIGILKSGDLNPHFFNYGSLTIYLHALIDRIYAWYLIDVACEIDSIKEVMINADTGWHWSISHPGFYYWNRVATVLMGTATVGVVYLIGRLVFNYWAGLLAAAFLATLPFHIQHSAYITADVPASFLMMVVAYCALRFALSNHMMFFYLALVSVGLAAATKYNAALSLLLPLGAMIWVHWRGGARYSLWHWAALGVVPAVVFVFVMPYAVIDFPAFLNDFLFEMRHYKISGHPGAQSTPGWEHMRYQLGQIYEHLGLLLSLVFVIGFVGSMARPVLLILWFFGLFYLWYMSGMKVNFHRNFLVLYPIIAVGIGAWLWSMHGVTKGVLAGKRLHVLVVALSAGSMMIVAFVGFRSLEALKRGHMAFAHQDSRTRVIDWLNDAKPIHAIHLAKSLHFHPQDLVRLHRPYDVLSLEEMSLTEAHENDLFVVPAWIKSQDPSNAAVAKSKQRYVDEVQKEDIRMVLGNPWPVWIDAPDATPKIVVVSKLPRLEPDPGIISLDTFTSDASQALIASPTSILMRGGRLRSMRYALGPGAYRMHLVAKQESAYSARSTSLRLAEYEAILTLKRDNEIADGNQLAIRLISDDHVIHQEALVPGKEWDVLDVEFRLASKRSVVFEIAYVGQTESSKPMSEIAIRSMALERIEAYPLRTD
jgi:hypothetical protein